MRKGHWIMSINCGLYFGKLVYPSPENWSSTFSGRCQVNARKRTVFKGGVLREGYSRSFRSAFAVKT